MPRRHHPTRHRRTIIAAFVLTTDQYAELRDTYHAFWTADATTERDALVALRDACNAALGTSDGADPDELRALRDAYTDADARYRIGGGKLRDVDARAQLLVAALDRAGT